MADGQLGSIWSQLNYATRTLSPDRTVLKVTIFLLLHCTGVFLCFSEPPEGGLDLVTNRQGAI